MSPEAIPLTRLRRGQSAIVRDFSPSMDARYRKRLQHIGINRQTSITLIRLAPFGDPLQLEVLGSQFSVRASEARHIYVNPVR